MGQKWTAKLLDECECKKKTNRWKKVSLSIFVAAGSANHKRFIFCTMPRIKLFLSFHWIWQFASIATRGSFIKTIENYLGEWLFPLEKSRTNLCVSAMGLSNLLCLAKGFLTLHFSLDFFFVLDSLTND